MRPRLMVGNTTFLIVSCFAPLLDEPADGSGIPLPIRTLGASLILLPSNIYHEVKSDIEM